MWEPDFPAFRPVQFFNLTLTCNPLSSKEDGASFPGYALPATGWLTHETTFADCAMGWHQEGLKFQILVKKPLEKSIYPHLTKGDAVELFLDTRDMKSARIPTRFCHHFFFLPQAVEEIQRGELSRFRGEDSHPLCDPEQLVCDTRQVPEGYVMQLFLHSEVLYGYDPAQFNRIGFTYRISRFGGNPQHFSVVSPDFSIEQNPSLWASLKLS